MPDILVCVKAVPATMQVQVDGQYRLQRSGVALQWNIADEAALEAALRQKGNGSVTLLTMGPEKLEDPLRKLLACGADRAVLITDPAMVGADTHATARALAAAVNYLGKFDLIFCGRRAVDGETGQVPSQLAAALGLPCVTNVQSLKCVDGSVCLVRQLEGGTVQMQGRFPMVITICEYSYPLRLPGIMGMRRAKNQPITHLTAQNLGLGRKQCGLQGSLTKVIAMESSFPGLRNGTKETDLTKAIPILKQEVGL